MSVYVPQRGDLVLVGFPFTDLTAVKVRPAVVVSPAAYQDATSDVVLAAVSSVVPKRMLPTELTLLEGTVDFNETGLKRTSVVLCGKLFTMERRLVLRRLGRLGGADLERLNRALGAAVGVGPWKPRDTRLDLSTFSGRERA